MLNRDGIGAVRHIGARVMTISDQSVAALSSWYNEPAPITKAQAVSNALVEWLRVTEQLIRGSNLEGGLKGFENVVKRTSNGAYRSPRCLAVTKHPMNPGGSSIISL